MTQDTWIAFVRTKGDESWRTLDIIDDVVAVSLTTPSASSPLRQAAVNGAHRAFAGASEGPQRVGSGRSGSLDVAPRYVHM